MGTQGEVSCWTRFFKSWFFTFLSIETKTCKNHKTSQNYNFSHFNPPKSSYAYCSPWVGNFSCHTSSHMQIHCLKQLNWNVHRIWKQPCFQFLWLRPSCRNWLPKRSRQWREEWSHHSLDRFHLLGVLRCFHPHTRLNFWEVWVKSWWIMVLKCQKVIGWIEN